MIGNVTQNDSADDTAAKENGLSQRYVTGSITHPIILTTTTT